MNSFKSFPPADDMISIISKIDWVKVSNVTIEGISEFLAIVEHILMLTVAFCSVCYQKWQEHKITSKLINAAQVAYVHLQTTGRFFITTGLWLRDVAYPVIRQSAQKSYTFTKATWVTVSDIYTLATSRQFVSL